MLRIGLTGGIGSGKSAVAALFAARGVTIVDTDELARDLVLPGSPAHGEIVAAFGRGMFDAEGNLDRAKMRTAVFSNPAQRMRLEAILHPRIRDEVHRTLDQLAAPYAIVAVPLLIETDFDDLIDRILVVDCNEETQVKRTAARSGMGESEVKRVMSAQATRSQRLARASDVIDNNGPMRELEPQVEALHRLYLSLARG